MTLSDQWLIAYADGELAPELRAKVDAEAVADPDLAARLKAHLRLREIVSGAFADIASEPAPAALVRAAGAEMASDVLRFRPKVAEPSPRWWAASIGLIAAGLAIGLFVGSALQSQAGPALIGADMGARGRLVHALDNQLAANPGVSTVRIGLTFRKNDGAVCRTFQVVRPSGVAGLACHAGDGWRVQIAVAAAAEANAPMYRKASSPLPTPVADLAQSLAAGAPLDAKAEAQARDRHWETLR